MVSTPAAPAASPVTLITQTRVLPELNGDFGAWQQRISAAVAAFPGFIDDKVIPPNPPSQTDWVVVQRFASTQDAQAWLRSPERQRLVDIAQPMLVGRDDIHVIEGEANAPAESVSAVISQRIAPGQEEAYRVWGQRIATAQAQFPGFQGFRVNPPVPGVQEDWVTVLQFDTEQHLDAWMTSPERQRLLDEAQPFTTETHYRTVRSGFDQWFRVGGAAQAPAWKQNMLVLLGLYPVVFLFGFFVGTPLLSEALGLPFWLVLFIGNVAGVVILNWLVPWISGRFGWWLQPAGSETRQRTVIGIAILLVLYALLLLAFALFPPSLR